MPSPFRQHQQAVRAALISSSAPVGYAPEIDPANPAAAEYQQMVASLHNDLRALHDIQSVQEKIERKRSMIDTYLPWVNGALDAGAEGRAVQDEIVVTIMIWAFDIQNWELALDLAQHVLTHGLALPERHKRTAATLIAEEIADAAKTDPASVDLAQLQRASSLTAEFDKPDQVKAKLLRAIGLALSAQAETFDPAAENAAAGGVPALVDAALLHLKEALRFDKNVGVKKQIEQLERQAKKLAEEAAAKQE